MKKLFAAVMCLVLLAGASAAPVWAQTSRGRYAERARASQAWRYENPRRAYDARRYRDRSFWDEHRDKVTVAAGTGAGAVIGALAGGKSGAVIGALIGAGGSALYTYKLRDRHERRYRRR